MNNTVNKYGLENWVGRNALGVLATILVLIGLALLGVTFIPYIPDAAKGLLVYLFAAFLTAAGTITMHRRANGFSTALLVCGVGAFLVAIMLGRYSFGLYNDTPTFVLAVVWALLCLGLAFIVRSDVLAGSVLTAMVFWGFPYLGALSPATGLELIFGSLVVGTFALVEYRLISVRFVANPLSNTKRNAFVASLVACEIALFALGESSRFAYSSESVLVAIMAGLVGLAFLRITKQDARYYLPVRINEVAVTVYASLFASLNSANPVSTVLCGLAVMAVLAIATIRVHELPLASEKSMVRKPALLVLGALAPTFYLTGYLWGCTELVDEPAAYTAILMACALVIIAVGFKFNAAPLRITGLILTLLCVFKLTTVDIVGFDSAARVLAFVGGGLICFAISALYNYACKQTQ